MRYAGARILVFARAPVPGRCKTRLAPSLGARGAAALQRKLIDKTLETAVASGLAPVELWCAPDASHPFLRRCRAGYGPRLRQQCRGELGRRMGEALRRSLRECQHVVLIGTDCPALTAADLARAFERLRAGDRFVVQPAEDGGYVLVGAAAVEPRLFRNIRWGSRHVMSATRRRLARLGSRWSELPMLWDLDRPADLRRAQREGLI